MPSLGYGYLASQRKGDVIKKSLSVRADGQYTSLRADELGRAFLIYDLLVGPIYHSKCKHSSSALILPETETSQKEAFYTVAILSASSSSWSNFLNLLTDHARFLMYLPSYASAHVSYASPYL